jgi:hypothetical protein
LVLKPESTSVQWTMTTLVATLRHALCALPDARKGGNNQRYTMGATSAMNNGATCAGETGSSRLRICCMLGICAIPNNELALLRPRAFCIRT